MWRRLIRIVVQVIRGDQGAFAMMEAVTTGRIHLIETMYGAKENAIRDREIMAGSLTTGAVAKVYGSLRVGIIGCSMETNTF